MNSPFRPRGAIMLWLSLVALPGLAGCAAAGPGVTNRGVGQERWQDSVPRKAWNAYARVPQDQDWFDVHTISDGVIAIYEPGQYEGVISYLITGRDRALLFDTGLGVGDMRRVVLQLTSLEVAVLNSHTHYDHIGGNYQFDTIYGTDRPYTQRNSMGSSTGERAEFLRPDWLARALPAGFSVAGYRSQPFTVTRTVADGDVIDLGGRRLEVLLTPGHAPDSLCLLDRDARVLFTGDTFYPGPLYTHISESDFDAYAQSVSRLAAMANAYDYVYTAHDVPVASGEHMLALDRAFRAIRDGTARDMQETDGNRQYFFDDFSIIVDPAALAHPDQ